MAEEVGYTLAQKTELQSRADYFANLYTLRLDSQKAETKENEKEKDMKMEDVLKSTRESLNHATFYDSTAKSTDLYQKKILKEAPVHIYCDESCVCEKCYTCICANDKNKRNTGPPYVYDGTRCLSIKCIPMIDRSAFQIGMRRYYTRKTAKVARGVWVPPKDNLPMSLRQSADCLVNGKDYISEIKDVIGTGSVQDSNLSINSIIWFNPEIEDQNKSISETQDSPSLPSGSKKMGTSSRQLVLAEPCIEDIICSSFSRPREQDCLLNLNEINELLELIELEGLHSMDDTELSMLYSQKAMLHIFLYEFEVAHDMCEKSLCMKPTYNYDALYVQGCAGYCQRDYDLALASFQEALYINSSSLPAKIALKVTLARLACRKDREYMGDI